jgi:hypothetical protein
MVMVHFEVEFTIWNFFKIYHEEKEMKIKTLTAQLLLATALFMMIVPPIFAEDTLIVPGVRVGEFKVGEMNLETIETRFGTPSKKGQTCMGIIVQYDEIGLRFYFEQRTKTLKRIRTLNRDYHTPSGLKPGSDISVAMDEFRGTNISDKGIFDCEQSGITFYYSKKTNRITSISINKLE